MQKRSIVGFGIALGFVLALSCTLFFISPEDIVDKLGVENSYIVLAVLSLLGGTSIITTTSVYASVGTLCAGGLNPFITGGILGVTLTIGDSLFYFLGYKTRDIGVKKVKKYAKILGNWLKKKPKPVIAIATYCYAAFIPLPNDVLLFSLALGNIKYKSIIVYVALGNATIMFLLCAGARVFS